MRGRTVPTIVPPPHIQAVIDDDDAFFAAHPELHERIRPYVPGEIVDERGVEYPPRSGLVYVAHIGGPIRARFAAEVRTRPDIVATIRVLRERYAAQE